MIDRTVVELVQMGVRANYGKDSVPSVTD
jgi:hypothetical protein